VSKRWEAAREGQLQKLPVTIVTGTKTPLSNQARQGRHKSAAEATIGTNSQQWNKLSIATHWRNEAQRRHP
jgi:hypothetical protein